jgi:hypothetical protein
MDSIQAEVCPLCFNYPLASINSQQLPGVLSFSQARDLEQAMASYNPSNMEVQRDSEFNLFRVGTEAQYGLFKWCKIFGVMTKGKKRPVKSFRRFKIRKSRREERKLGAAK